MSDENKIEVEENKEGKVGVSMDFILKIQLLIIYQAI
jgi:hypothetical protein